MGKHFFRVAILVFAFACCITSCSSPLLEWQPETISDTTPVTITCNAEKGNKGLLNFKGPVYVHVGLITDSSKNPNDWRYVRFKWGTADPAAEAKRIGRNRWSFTIPNIRQFFQVDKNEKIFQIAILFRAGDCYDTDCNTQRNEDNSDMFIPVSAK
jgi:hypothetical protein